MSGDREGMLAHAADYMQMFSIFAIAWQWIRMAAAARAGLERDRASADFYRGKIAAARYWLATELPRIPQLARLSLEDDSFLTANPEWF
jgi:butyryl-CoA dehydrogenase